MISIKDFKKMDLRIGKILNVEQVPSTENLYKLITDIGGRQVQMVAGIAKDYGQKELKGKEIVVVANLEPAVIKGVKSEAMLLAAVGKKIVLVVPDKQIDPGTKVE